MSSDSDNVLSGEVDVVSSPSASAVNGEFDTISGESMIGGFDAMHIGFDRISGKFGLDIGFGESDTTLLGEFDTTLGEFATVSCRLDTVPRPFVLGFLGFLPIFSISS